MNSIEILLSLATDAKKQSCYFILLRKLLDKD